MNALCLPPFCKIPSSPSHLLVNDCSTLPKKTGIMISMKLHMYTYGQITECRCEFILPSRMTLTFQGHNFVKSHFLAISWLLLGQLLLNFNRGSMSQGPLGN